MQLQSVGSHTKSPEQSLLTRQATHRPVVGLQRGVVPAHCASETQAAHRPVVALQYGVATGHSRPSSHSSQIPSSQRVLAPEQSVLATQVCTQLP